VQWKLTGQGKNKKLSAPVGSDSQQIHTERLQTGDSADKDFYLCILFYFLILLYWDKDFYLCILFYFLILLYWGEQYWDLNSGPYTW
jgi:hypothetical protein